MRIIKPRVELLYSPAPPTVSAIIEQAGRTCYKSESMITADSAETFCQKIIRSGHDSVLEHVSITVGIICDRGVSHQLVRHRLASYSQESTRYANYAKDRFNNEITVIDPEIEDTYIYSIWENSCLIAEQNYLRMVNAGVAPEIARSVLPNSLKTELVMTANIRQWKHIINLRSSLRAHPQMRQVIGLLQNILHERLPVFFGEKEGK